MTDPTPLDLLAAARWDLLPGRPWAGLADPCTSGAVHSHRVRGELCRTKPELFNEWAKALAFPAYFGHNWDAFEECLADTRYPPRQSDPAGLLILVSGAEAVLVDEPVRELTILLQVLDTAATDVGPSLRVLFLSDDPGAVERRLRAATRAM
ncbi:barstar family protein [Kitasatospora sp. NPDC088351]|uniref:barstar family protein n=1 Tax=unclassified Kitasatospora TaxID=2633591 RepID=UPI003428039A